LPRANHLQELLAWGAESLERANQYLNRLQRVVRVETKDTPAGLALDLARSTGPASCRPDERADRGGEPDSVETG